MTFTVKDFLAMFAMNDTTIEVDIGAATDSKLYGYYGLVYDHKGERKTCEGEINKYADAVVLKTDTSTDDDGIILFTLYIDPNDKNIKK